ncbi:MAG TPA: serine hydrolase, partial [Pseudoxanthomonas sp.]|nr:serine hydrolase [Pseudoxanthomonas sp.]
GKPMRLLKSSLFLLLSVPLCAFAAPPSRADVAAYAERLLAGNNPDDAPGMAVLVARGDEVLYRDAHGAANLQLGVPLSPDQVFRIGSVTKQFAAAAVLKLAEDGKLSLDDPLTKFVPGYPGGDKVTVRMLLNHTSGIRSYTDMPGMMEGPIRKTVTTAQLIDTFKNEKPDFAPGEGWHYNNSGYVLVGAVIEAASGMPWHAYLKEALFKPLGMQRTGYGNEDIAIVPGHVTGYARVGEQWALAQYLSMTQPHAAGALVSTLDDLNKWNRALHRGKVLKADSYRAMTTPTGKAVDSGYGYGITAGTLRGEPVLQHGGGIPGFSSYLLYLPASDTTVAVLYNADSGGPGMLGTGYIANELAAHAIGKPYPEKKKKIEVDAATLAQYEGVYRIDKDAARVLRVKEGVLVSQRTGGQAYALIPVANDTFLFEEGYSRMVFERDGSGRVSAMRFFPEDEGEGEVVKRSDEPLPSERASVTLAKPALERLVGKYAYQGMAMTVALDGEKLTTQLAGQPAFELFAESPTKFFLKVVEASLEFAPGDAPATSVTLRQGGQTLEFKREVP